MIIQKETPDVFYISDSPLLLSNKDFDGLIDLAFNSKRHRARYCAHKNKESSTHEMFEVFTPETYLCPLKQEKKIYSFHIIRGCVDVYLFTDDGKLVDAVSLGDFQSGKPFYYRAPVNTYRTLVTTTEFLLYQEVTSGPFSKGDTIFAPWAPKEDDAIGIKHFFSELKKNSQRSVPGEMRGFLI